jgi:hypothetical protein
MIASPDLLNENDPTIGSVPELDTLRIISETLLSWLLRVVLAIVNMWAMSTISYSRL